MYKSAADVLESINQYEQCVATIDQFIDGVESGIKQANLSNEQALNVWGSICNALEKSAANDAVAPVKAPEVPVNPNTPMAHPATPSAEAPAFHAPSMLDKLKRRISGVNWKQPGTWQSALVGGGLGALGGLAGTALFGQKDEEGRKHYLRNALLSGLAGAGVAPYLAGPMDLKGMAKQHMPGAYAGAKDLYNKAKAYMTPAAV